MAVVYIHSEQDTGKPFYVGMGEKEYRAFNFTGRSLSWQDKSDKYGVIVEIVADNLSTEDAFELELYLIKVIGRIDICTGNLVNQKSGQPSGYETDKQRRIREIKEYVYNKHYPIDKKCKEKNRRRKLLLKRNYAEPFIQLDPLQSL